MTDSGTTAGARALAVEHEAILNISRAPVYEERGNPASGISLTMLRAIREAVEVVEGKRTTLTPLDACHHDFGMLGVCVHCGASPAPIPQDPEAGAP